MPILPLALALLVSPVTPPPDAVAAPSPISVLATPAPPAIPSRGVPPLLPLRVVAPFDPPLSAYASGHRGVDLAGQPGQPVVSALPGIVTTAGTVAGVPVVVVDHGEVRTTYQPVVAAVSAGEAVGAGASLGTLMSSGGHCLPATCLHWGLRRGEAYLDPMSLLGPRPVRLLPRP